MGCSGVLGIHHGISCKEIMEGYERK